jgi:putative membrane protein
MYPAQHFARLRRRIGMSTERADRNTWLAWGLLVLLVVLGLSSFGGGMMGHAFVVGNRPLAGAPWLWGIGLFGFFVRLLIWGALIVLAVRFFRHMSARSETEARGSDTSALEILKRRYAAGEITREQFEEMRGVLEPRS